PLPAFYRVASDIIRWAPEIFNFHRAGGRWCNGRLEGTNNLLGLLKRMGLGFLKRRQLRSPRHSPHPRSWPMKSRSLHQLVGEVVQTGIAGRPIEGVVEGAVDRDEG